MRAAYRASSVRCLRDEPCIRCKRWAHCAIVPFDVGRPPTAGPAVIRASAQRRLRMSLRDAWRTP